MKIAILGPKGTFSESASLFYEEKTNNNFEHVFFNNIDQTFNAIGPNCDIGIIPIENTLDGYVQQSLDSLLNLDLEIIDEVQIPVKFSLTSNCKNKDEIRRIYVQFKAHGQCLKFTNSFNDVEIITTQSNTESYNLFKADNSKSCAIIPSHIFEKNDKYFSIDDVTDSDSNFTRFIILRKKTSRQDLIVDKKIKVSLFIIPNNDRAGILYEILENFYKNKINLISIMSRPTKVNLGTYNFYIELMDSFNNKDVILKTLENISNDYNIKVLGIYSI